MFSTMLLLFLAYLSMECDAIDVKYEEYRGLDKQVDSVFKLTSYCSDQCDNIVVSEHSALTLFFYIFNKFLYILLGWKNNCDIKL